ncbi:MAG: choice-of-anchor D domain-containing protein [Candidatus Krumholzibacteriia bacterium]
MDRARLLAILGGCVPSILLLLAWAGCTDEIVTPERSGGLKVALSDQAEAVDHGWLVLDGNHDGREFMTRVGTYLESEPIIVEPGIHLFEITAVAEDETPLFYGAATDTIAPGAGSVDVDIVLRVIGPSCAIEPDHLDFGTVQVGTAVRDTLTVTNLAGALGNLPLDVQTSCPGFTIVQGGGAADLEPGASLLVVLEFRPLAGGPFACSLDWGTDCPTIPLTGFGEDPPECLLDPASAVVDFGQMETGETLRSGFTITNGGGGLLTGEVSLPGGCGAFSLVFGAGPFQLAAGGSLEVVIDFHPGAPGTFSCEVATGSGCGLVTLTGTASPPPVCSLTPASGLLDFGSVLIGGSAELAFAIANTGGGLLTGTVPDPECAGFVLAAGGGAFSLGAGESRSVTVVFQPEIPGPYECELDLGAACGPFVLTGTAEDLPPLCAVDLSGPVLDFGMVEPGQSASLSFRLSNAGGSVLEGSVSPPGCPEFSLTAGEGEYALEAGESVLVTVRFAPGDEGPAACDLDVGAACGAISLTGEGVGTPVCALDPAGGILDFGGLTVGETADLSFSLANVGGGLLEGAIIPADCTGFTLQSGAGAFQLAAAESRTVTVRFAPQEPGTHTCVVETGTACGGVTLVGTAEDAPACAVDPAAGGLDFGVVTLGSSAQATVTITNTGGGLLEGSVPTLDCPGFSLVSGTGDYSLGADESLEVTIRFAPTVAGEYSCELDPGAGCGPVPLTGTGERAPICSINLQGDILDFGAVLVGETGTESLIITNLGGGLLEGSVPVPACPDFTVTSGGGPFALAGGQSRTVVLAFSPSSEGDRICGLSLGTPCGSIQLIGTGYTQPECAIEPETLRLQFGSVPVGETTDLDFIITNVGTGILSGTVFPPDCQGFGIVAGGGSYALAAGQSRTVTVRFAPEEATSYSCQLSTGASCEPVVLTGTGLGVPLCSVSPTSLDFGVVGSGQYVQRTVTISNLGTGALTGYVALNDSLDCCVIVSGGGPLLLQPGQSRVVTLGFQATEARTYAFSLAIGTPCGEVPCTAVIENGGICSIIPASGTLDFGFVGVGQTARRTMCVTNVGTADLAGSIILDQGAFYLVLGGGPFNLAPGDTVFAVVEFYPYTSGEFTATLTTGTDCGDVVCRGTGVLGGKPAPLEPREIDFGKVEVGQAVELPFTITNAETRPISGVVVSPCAGFRVADGGGRFVLDPGESHEVTVAFAPPGTGLFTCKIYVGPDKGGGFATFLPVFGEGYR